MSKVRVSVGSSRILQGRHCAVIYRQMSEGNGAISAAPEARYMSEIKKGSSISGEMPCETRASVFSSIHLAKGTN